jgi:6-phosphogluconolactonase
MRNDSDLRNMGMGAVYVQTNERGGNQLLAFQRGAGGELMSAGGQPTGGSGDGAAHLPSQGSVTLTGDQRHLLVTNADSGDFSVFALGAAGPNPLRTVASGAAPKSVAEHDGLIYVLNTGEPSLTGFRLRGETIEAIPGSTQMLDADSDPAQVGFSPDGTTLVVTERGANAIATYQVGADGHLMDPHMQPSPGPTPYGFAFAPQGPLIVVEAFGAQKGKAAASSYVSHSVDIEPVSRSVGNGHSEVCWATVSKDGRYAFTTNFADSAVSRYAIAPDGSISLDDPAAAVGHEGQSGLRDEDVSEDGRFLYAIDADSGQIFGWSVGNGGALAAIGFWDGLPRTAAGLAAS